MHYSKSLRRKNRRNYRITSVLEKKVIADFFPAVGNYFLRCLVFLPFILSIITEEIPWNNAFWPTAVVGEADCGSSVSALVCHTIGPKGVTPSVTNYVRQSVI